jgi:hypothetical protein
MATGRVPTTANSPLTAKGDLFGYSTTQARVPVGNDGETIVADSSTSTGLRYQGSTAAGRNFIINGGFDIWQRGTSFNTTNGGNAYNADRWTYYGGNTGTITRSTALLRDGAQYAARFTSTGASGKADLYQMVETANTVQLQGKVVTLSVYVAGTVGKTAQVDLLSSTSDDAGLFGSYTTLSPSGTSTVTTSGTYQRITAQFTVPADSRTLRIGLLCPSLANTEFISWTQTQLEVGSVATNFSRAGGSIQGELAACQRYYYRADATAGATPISNFGNAWSTSNADIPISYPVTMRARPTVMDTSNIIISDNGAVFSGGTFIISNNQVGITNIRYTHGSAALTAYRGYQIVSSVGSAGYVGLSAEL